MPSGSRYATSAALNILRETATSRRRIARGDALTPAIRRSRGNQSVDNCSNASAADLPVALHRRRPHCHLRALLDAVHGCPYHPLYPSNNLWRTLPGHRLPQLGSGDRDFLYQTSTIPVFCPCLTNSEFKRWYANPRMYHPIVHLALYWHSFQVLHLILKPCF